MWLQLGWLQSAGPVTMSFRRIGKQRNCGTPWTLRQRRPRENDKTTQARCPLSSCAAWEIFGNQAGHNAQPLDSDPFWGWPALRSLHTVGVLCRCPLRAVSVLWSTSLGACTRIINYTSKGGAAGSATTATTATTTTTTTATTTTTTNNNEIEHHMR